MPGPFEQPETTPDLVLGRLEEGHRCRQILALGVGLDLQTRRNAVYRQAEDELKAGALTPERAFMHIACGNALRRYEDELASRIKAAQKTANDLHDEVDGDA